MHVDKNLGFEGVECGGEDFYTALSAQKICDRRISLVMEGSAKWNICPPNRKVPNVCKQEIGLVGIGRIRKYL